MPTDGEPTPKCFIAMPISMSALHKETYTPDPEHWLHVMESLFVPAVEAAGYEPVIPKAKGSYLIHENIIRNLEQCEMVLVDLSADNPNVFFELGVRTSLNLPIAVVTDGKTKLPFDTSGINTHDYSAALEGWKLDGERDKLKQHIQDAAESCQGTNPLWRQFGLTIRATAPDAEADPVQAQLGILINQVNRLVQGSSNEQDAMVELERASMVEQLAKMRAGDLIEWEKKLFPYPSPSGTEGHIRSSTSRSEFAEFLHVRQKREEGFEFKMKWVGQRKAALRLRTTLPVNYLSAYQFVDFARAAAREFEVEVDIWVNDDLVFSSER